MTEELSREELAAVLGVRQEKGAEIEPALVDSLARKVDQVVERRFRAEQEVRARKRPTDIVGQRLALAIISMGLGIPLTAIAGEVASVFGFIIAWVGIVFINVAFNFGGRHDER